MAVKLTLSSKVPWEKKKILRELVAMGLHLYPDRSYLKHHSRIYSWCTSTNIVRRVDTASDRVGICTIHRVPHSRLKLSWLSRNKAHRRDFHHQCVEVYAPNFNVAYPLIVPLPTMLGPSQIVKLPVPNCRPGLVIKLISARIAECSTPYVV